MWPMRFGNVFRFARSFVGVHGGGGACCTAASGAGGCTPAASPALPAAGALTWAELCTLQLCCDTPAS